LSDEQCGASPAERVRLNRCALRRRLAVAAAVLCSWCLILVAAVPATAAPTPGPCDIYGLGGTPCVAAYSTTRAMYAGYHGPLYEVQRLSDSATLAVGSLSTGYVDAAAQDRFCADTSCEITELIDQSPDGNDLTVEGPGANGGQDSGVNAAALPISIAGQQAYGMDFGAQMGYRDDSTRGVATGAEPESMYMVTAGNHYNSSCCFDFGNAETSERDTGNGHMDAIYFGSDCWREPPWCPSGGPWVQADLENGIIASSNGENQDPSYRGSTSPFVTAVMENNGTNALVLATADAQSGPLDPVWAGPLPTSVLDPDPPSFILPYPENPTQTEVVNPLLSGYAPMHKEGGIVLGTGGDDSNAGVGSFFEGAITEGVPSLSTAEAIQANIIAAGYSSTPSSPVSDTPQFAVRTQARQAVAAVLCPVICTARVTMTVQALRARRLIDQARVQSAARTLAGASVLRLALPPRVLRQARRLGLTRLSATVEVQAATTQPGTPSAARTVRLSIRL
jgi:hypothetical protein